MKDSNLLLDSIEAMNSKMNIIAYEKAITDELSSTFLSMGEHFGSLTANYKNFNDKMQFVIKKMEKLNAFISEDVLEEYYNIYRNVGDRVGETYHKLSSISDELKK